MIKHKKTVGYIFDAPMILWAIRQHEKDWVAFTRKNNFGHVSICFWSEREDNCIETEDLLSQLEKFVTENKNDVDTLSEIVYFQPKGWDRWLSGIPNPIRNYFENFMKKEIAKEIS